MNSVHYFSKKKRKIVFMISTSKELGTIKTKRKWSFKPFNLDDIKTKRKERVVKYKEDTTNK